jgi:hypothetical protein
LTFTISTKGTMPHFNAFWVDHFTSITQFNLLSLKYFTQLKLTGK